MFSNDLLLDDDEETPIHLQPYDPSKYEVPSQNVKYATGYAFLDVDPFPRASVMKLCYAILDRLNSPRIPEDCMYRMYTEEMIKYFMNLTDQIEDIPKLESELGFDSIEIFIQNLKDELELVDDMERFQPWAEQQEQTLDPIWASRNKQELRHQLYERQEREKAKFIKQK